MEHLLTFEHGSIKVETFYKGTENLPFKVYLNGKLIYEDFYKPSPLYGIDSTEAMNALLWFLTVQKEDVEESYFIARNCPALDKWAETLEADEIRGMIFDFEESETPEYLEANEMTEEFAKRIELLIN